MRPNIVILTVFTVFVRTKYAGQNIDIISFIKATILETKRNAMLCCGAEK